MSTRMADKAGRKDPRLTEPEALKWVQDLNDWFSVGMKIGVSFSKLRALEDKYPMDAVTARTEMIQIWLADDPNASWSALADGMEYAQQNALARRIRETYNCPRPHVKQIRFPVLKPIKSSTRPKAKNVIYAPYFPTAVPPPLPLSPPPSTAPFFRTQKVFECFCHNYLFKTKLEADRLESPFMPYVEYVKLQQESNAMISHFIKFVGRILQSFASRAVSLHTLVDCVLSFGAFTPNQEQMPLLQHRLQQLKSAYSVTEVFIVISDYVNYFNHALLVHIIEALGCDQDQEELEDFMGHYERFSSYLIFKTPMYMYSYLWLKTEMLIVLRLDEDWVPGCSCTGKELSLYLQRICKIISVLPHAMHLCRLKSEPPELVCHMPPVVVDEVFPLTESQEKKLAEARVVQLHCFDYCFEDPKKREETRSYFSADSLDKIHRDMIIDHFAYDKPLERYTRILPQVARRRRLPGTHPISTRVHHHLSQELVFGQLKVCCQRHEHVGQLYCQYRGLVTEGDRGYDADTEASTALPKVLIKRHSRQRKKRLRWHLAHSYF